MNELEMENRIIQIVSEHNSNPYGITKSELARIFIERWGSSRSTLWDYIRDLIDAGKIELRKVKNKQHSLFMAQ